MHTRPARTSVPGVLSRFDRWAEGEAMADDVVPDPIDMVLEVDGAGVDWIVLLARFTERLNEPFELSITLATADIDIEPLDLLGKKAKLSMRRADVDRQVTGIVSGILERGDGPTEAQVVQVIVKPAFEALRHRINTKIFQEKTVPEILEEVLGEGLGAYGRETDPRLTRTYRPCDYRVQYDESDL